MRVDVREWVLSLPWQRQPLSANARLHWAERARVVGAIRTIGKLAARQARIPRLEKFTAELHLLPPDNRRRDQDNLVPTLKALVDGLIDAGIADDDDRTRHVMTAPIIHPHTRADRPAMWLVVRDLTGGAE